MRIATPLLALLTACYGTHGGSEWIEEGDEGEPYDDVDEAPADEAPDADPPEVVPPEELPPEEVPPVDAVTCAGDAQLDFVVSGHGLEAWDGARVAAAALENDMNAGIDVPARRPVLLSSTIADGAFALSCDRSLSENYGYPSYALYVDVDGDGRCSAGDVGYQMQLYGWNDSVADDLDTSELYPLDAGGLGPAIGADASDFCGSYFE